LFRKFANYKRHVKSCNNKDGSWRIIVWQTKENADVSEAAFELTRIWLFNYCKSFKSLPEQQRESAKQQVWIEFETEAKAQTTARCYY
jgi:hypothetical protein